MGERAAMKSLLVMGVLLLACGASTESQVEAGAPPPVCPDTIPLAVGTQSKCTTENYVCPIGYMCGSFPQQAYCACRKNGDVLSYACKTVTNKDIPAGTTDMTPFCQTITPPDPTCPPDEASASKQVCGNAGLQCFYEGATCTGGQKLTNVCECRSGFTWDGSTGLVFFCEDK